MIGIHVLWRLSVASFHSVLQEWQDTIPDDSSEWMNGWDSEAKVWLANFAFVPGQENVYNAIEDHEACAASKHETY